MTSVTSACDGSMSANSTEPGISTFSPSKYEALLAVPTTTSNAGSATTRPRDEHGEQNSASGCHILG